ncbi:MAG: transposase [Cyanobacteria bacterium QS_3_48_167]|nr:MAG: transposase [Cyanobacteria bacterium QS_3_48_167]
MLTLSYEYKLEPTKAQILQIDEWLEFCRKVYNHALASRKAWVNSRKCSVHDCSIQSEYIIPADAKRPTYASQCKELAAAKKEYPDLKFPQSHVLQQTLKRLENAFVGMWERGFGFPMFKKVGGLRSFVFPELGKEVIKGKHIKLPKLGWVKLRLSRPIPDGFQQIKQARVIRKAKGYFVVLSLQSDVSVPEVSLSGYPIGIDMGLESFLATSENELIARPKFLDCAYGKLKSLQRKLKFKKKGSRNWNQVKQRIARLHFHIFCKRKDWHFKLAHRLCDGVGAIFAEDLNLKAMSRGMLCKHTWDASFGQFLEILRWVCFKRGVYFAKVDPNGTSQICPNCPTHTGKKPLSVRTHHCLECGYAGNRDVVAAQVLRERGLSTVGQTGKMLAEGKDFGELVYTSSRISL